MENNEMMDLGLGQEKEKSKKSLVIAFITVAILIIIGVGSMFYIESQKDYIDGNVLNIGYWGDSLFTTKTVTTPWSTNTVHSQLMFRTLFHANYDSTEFWGDMSTGYSLSEDGNTYTVTLRDDLVWSDGVPVTPKDVQKTVEGVLLSTENINGTYTTMLGNLVGADEFKNNPSGGLSGFSYEGNDLIFTFRQPNQQFIKIMAQIVVFPDHCFTHQDFIDGHNLLVDYWSNPVVCGMYVLDNIVDDGVNKYFSLVPNESYVGDQPKIEEIRLLGSTDPTPPDYYSTTDVTEIITYSSNKDYTKYDSVQMFYKYFVFDSQGVDGHVNEPFNDVRVRQAVSYAIDMDKLFYEVLLQEGDLIHSGVPTSYDAYNGKTMEYNPEKAKELLVEAGYDFDRVFTIGRYYSDETSVFFVDSVAQMLRDIGMTVEVLHLTNTTSQVYDEHLIDMFLKGYTAFDVYDWYAEMASSHALFSKIVYSTEFDEILNRLEITVDPEEYNDVLRDAQDLDLEHLYKIPLYTANVSMYIRESRVSIPADTQFGNTRYRFYLDFADWEIKKAS